MTLIQFKMKYRNAGLSVQDGKLAPYVLFYTASIELNNLYWNSCAVDAYIDSIYRQGSVSFRIVYYPTSNIPRYISLYTLSEQIIAEYRFSMI